MCLCLDRIHLYQTSIEFPQQQAFGFSTNVCNVFWFWKCHCNDWLWPWQRTPDILTVEFTLSNKPKCKECFKSSRFQARSILLMLAQRIYLALKSRNIYPWFMFVYLYNELIKFKSSKGSVDSVPGLSQSRLCVWPVWTWWDILGDLLDVRTREFWHPDSIDIRTVMFWHQLKPASTEFCTLTLWHSWCGFGWSGWVVSFH